MKIANYVFGVIRISIETIVIMIASFFGAGYILEDILWSDEWFAVLFIPFAICCGWKLVKLEIIEIRELSKMLK